MKYALWLVWSNFITILATLQGIVAALMLDEGIFTHQMFRWIVISNAILTAVIAQIKRNKPPSQSPP